MPAWRGFHDKASGILKDFKGLQNLYNSGAKPEVQDQSKVRLSALQQGFNEAAKQVEQHLGPSDSGLRSKMEAIKGEVQKIFNVLHTGSTEDRRERPSKRQRL